MLGLQRRWASFLIYCLHLMPRKTIKGCWEVLKTVLKCPPAKFSFDELVALQVLGYLIRGYLLTCVVEQMVNGFHRA